MMGKAEKDMLEAEENWKEYMLGVKEISDRLENEQNPQTNEGFV
jgi:hypothetical protein